MIGLRKEFNQALRNLFRNKRRSLVTGMAILSGFVGLTLLSGYVARVERYLMVNTVYLNHSGHIHIYKKDGLSNYYSRPSKYLLKQDDQQTLADFFINYKDETELISPYLLANGLLQFGTKAFPFQGKGIEPQTDEFTRHHPMVKRWTPELHQTENNGTPLYDAEDLHNPIKITFKLFDNLGKNKELNLQGLTTDQSFNALDATVSSLYSTGLDLTEETSMMTTNAVFQDLLATDGVTYLGVYLKNDLKTRLLSYEFNKMFKEKNLPYEAHPFTDERIGLFYTGTMNFLYAMAMFFFSLVSLVVILSIANAISMNIMERVRELGSMRAMGYTPDDLARLISIESFILGVFSISLGFILSQIIALIVNSSNIRFHPPGIAGDMQFIITPWPSLCLILALPLLIIAVVTAFVVTKRKVRGEVSKLLTDSTT